MYRLQELGDCFLLRFTDGIAQSNVLIDCGSFRNGPVSKGRLKKIVDNIKEDLLKADNKSLDVVVGTHQHNDHLSGFVHCSSTFAQIGVREVWLSWLDNANDAFAAKVKENEKNLTENLIKIRQHLYDSKNNPDLIEKLNDILHVAGFDEDSPEVPAKGMEVLKTIGQKPPRYLKPGTTIPLPGLSNEAVRVHVLGPPRDIDLIYDKDPGKGETYDPHISLVNSSALSYINLLKRGDENNSDEPEFPFNDSFKTKKIPKDLKATYTNPNNAWRKLNDDTQIEAEQFALYLHNFTNNCSLVLAFEIVSTGKVLLFAADAQTGNWNSWDKIPWPADKPIHLDTLLKQTVLYKVGHHGSHNSTLVSALERMNHPELVAMIPVHKDDPMIRKEKNPWKMPATMLYKRLKEKTNFRVLRMDEGYAKDCDNLPDSAWQSLAHQPEVNELYIDFKIV